jgi:hypothetical protein
MLGVWMDSVTAQVMMTFLLDTLFSSLRQVRVR